MADALADQSGAKPVTVVARSPSNSLAGGRASNISLAPMWSLICPSESSITIGQPLPSQTACNLEFRPLWCARYGGEQPFFNQAGRRAMSFQVGGVDHETIRLAALAGQRLEDPVEYPQTAPADKPVIQHLMRTIIRRRVPPPAAFHLLRRWNLCCLRQRNPLRRTKIIPLITRRSSTRGTPCDSGKYGSIRRTWLSVSENKLLMAGTSAISTITSTMSMQEF
jgi:hypothetical protein